jgi:hypothetical protein
VTSDEQRGKRKAMSDEKKAMSNEQRAMSGRELIIKE